MATEKMTKVELTTSEASQIQARAQVRSKLEQEINEKQFLVEVLRKDEIGYIKELGKKHNLIDTDNFEFKDGVLFAIPEKKPKPDTTKNSPK